VEVFNPKQLDKLLKAALLGLFPMKVKRPAYLSCCQGVVRTDSLDDISDDKNQQCLSDHFVSKAY
jgi:hypothetical protein